MKSNLMGKLENIPNNSLITHNFYTGVMELLFRSLDEEFKHQVNLFIERNKSIQKTDNMCFYFKKELFGSHNYGGGVKYPRLISNLDSTLEPEFEKVLGVYRNRTSYQFPLVRNFLSSLLLFSDDPKILKQILPDAVHGVIDRYIELRQTVGWATAEEDVRQLAIQGFKETHAIALSIIRERLLTKLIES